MSHKYSFHLRSEERRRALPPKIIIGRDDSQTEAHVLLKFLGYLLFFRDRLEIDPSLHDDSIPYRPNLVQLDYSLRPVLWVECGECSAGKLDKLAVKVPEAKIWIVNPSEEAARRLMIEMGKHELRRDRYGLIVLPSEMLTEMLSLLRPRNEVLLVHADLDSPLLQLDFNGLWFDTTFEVLTF